MPGGGILWLAVAAGLIFLAAGILYGSEKWRVSRRDPELQARSDAAMRENYRRGG